MLCDSVECFFVICEGVTEETKGPRVGGIKRKFNYVRFYVNYGVSAFCKQTMVNLDNVINVRAF